MRRYGFDYYAGANVVIEFDDMPILECVAFSANIAETKAPIYGYSSRHFDTVGRGQVLVQGDFAINYVHQDYLFALLSEANGDFDPGDEQRIARARTNSQGATYASMDRLDLAAEQGDYVQAQRVMDELVNQYWNSPVTTTRRVINPTKNLVDFAGGFNIKVGFGERRQENGFAGETGQLITSAYITSHGTPIQISEDVIIERYSYFARNIYSLNTAPIQTQG